VKLSYLASWYHDPGENYKYVSPDGHMEGVYNKENGTIVNDLDVKGTFNFFGPQNFWDHKDADVDPYNKWGTN